jgi:hypothetical protein
VLEDAKRRGEVRINDSAIAARQFVTMRRGICIGKLSADGALRQPADGGPLRCKGLEELLRVPNWPKGVGVGEQTKVSPRPSCNGPRQRHLFPLGSLHTLLMETAGRSTHMITFPHDVIRPQVAHQAGTGQAARHALDAHNLLRDAVKRELESEIRGLLMAARVHGFHIAIQNEKPVVTELPGLCAPHSADSGFAIG